MRMKNVSFLRGGIGNDVLVGSKEDDVIYGGSGDDRLYGKDGDDALFGDDGSDILSGDDGDDVLFGDDGNDILSGGDGADTLYGGEGADMLSGGKGPDTFVFNSVSDSLVTSPDTILDFESGIDKIDLSALNIKNRVMDYYDNAALTHASPPSTSVRLFGITYDDSQECTRLQFRLPGEDVDFQVIIMGQSAFSLQEDVII